MIAAAIASRFPLSPSERRPRRFRGGPLRLAWRVVNRSSQVSTGIAIRRRNSSTTCRACCACGPTAPVIESGSPMTTSSASCSSSSRSIDATGSFPPATAVSGTATCVRSSAAATPIRFSPRSRPIIRIRRSGVLRPVAGKHLPHRLRDDRQRLLDLRRVLPSALRHFRPSAATTPGHSGDSLQYLACVRALRNHVPAHDCHKLRPPLDHAPQHSHARRHCLPHRIGGVSQGIDAREVHLRRQHLHAVDVHRARNDLFHFGGRRERALQSLDLLPLRLPLRRPRLKTEDQAFSWRSQPPRYLLHIYLQGPHVLLRAPSGKRLNPPHSRSDRRLARNENETHIPRPLAVSASAKLS